jgi:hypothetical protein
VERFSRSILPDRSDNTLRVARCATCPAGIDPTNFFDIREQGRLVSFANPVTAARTLTEADRRRRRVTGIREEIKWCWAYGRMYVAAHELTVSGKVARS